VGFCILFCQKKLPLIEIQNFLEFNEFWRKFKYLGQILLHLIESFGHFSWKISQTSYEILLQTEIDYWAATMPPL
jgi:hypothetical protein